MQLRAENIMKSYRGRKVVRGISLEVNQGEIVGLLGPNGAGKTTCFYMIVGLVKADEGQVTVNGKDQEVYFARPTLRLVINQPFSISEREGQYDVIATVTGGGLSGQAGAVRHGISKALTNYEPDLRWELKPLGFLTRDSRVVERKKYGRAKARRSFQFSKR